MPKAEGVMSGSSAERGGELSGRGECAVGFSAFSRRVGKWAKLGGMGPNPLLLANALPTAQSAAVAQLFRLVAGDISQLPAGQTLPATVVKATAGETVLSLAGQQLTVKGTVPANVGDVVNVRVQPGAKPAVAVVGQEQTTPNPTPAGFAPLTTATPPQRGGVGQADNPTAGTPLPAGEGSASAKHEPGVGPKNPAVHTAGSPLVTPPRRGGEGVTGYRQPSPTSGPPVVVDVIARDPSGQLRVKIDGRETTATSPQPLQPGARYVVQLDRTPAGVVLRPLPDSPQLATTVATAILRTDKPPPLGDSLPSLVKELTTLPADPTVRTAAVQVKDMAVKLLPSPAEPPTAERIKRLVEDGGTHFEAKLARAADTTRPDRPDPPTPHTDLKSGLLSLARTVTNLSAAFPAAAATLDGIERQQAVNVLSQQNGGMAVFQIPFPDGPHWRTLGMGIEPDRGSEPDANGRPSGFRVMMHVPLSTLGETWIDASAESTRLRAVLYVSDASARDRVRAELPGLRCELQAGGFGEVLLDVRPAADLTESQRRKANAIREGVPEGGGLLDVTA